MNSRKLTVILSFGKWLRVPIINLIIISIYGRIQQNFYTNKEFLRFISFTCIGK